MTPRSDALMAPLIVPVQVMLQMRSLRYLTGLTRLQELVLRPRGYIQ